MKIWPALVVFAACGNHRSPPPQRDAGAMGAVGSAEAAAAGLPARPLGRASLDEFGWRARAGQAAFRAAQNDESIGDWSGAVRDCERALAADPTHLDAAWLLAIARAKTGALAGVTEPLAVAAAGDYGKWADASLVHPALAAYLETPAGAAWQHRVAADRPRYLAALAHSLVVRAGGELYAYDATSPRWYRLTRTNGHVIAALPAGHRYAYVTRAKGRLAVGAIDLDDGRSTHAVPIGIPAGALTIAPVPQGFWIGQGPVAHVLGLDASLTTATAQKPSGPTLTVSPSGAVRLARLPIASITADWDDHALASAIRIGTTQRIVTVPGPGVIAGNTVAWSPDRASIALVAQLSDQCVPHAHTVAAVVADVATGAIRELARATSGLAVEWVNDSELAIAGDTGVTLVPVAGGAATPLPGTTGLAAPMFTAKCTPIDTQVAEGSDEDEP